MNPELKSATSVTPRFLVRSLAGIRVFLLIAAVAVLNACGGGGGAEVISQTNQTNQTIDVSSTIAPNVKVWSNSQLQRIVSESTGQLTVSGPTDAKVGDIVLTNKTAIKITSISSLDQSGNTVITGSLPDLSDVFVKLDIVAKNYAITPDNFVPADSSVTVSTVNKSQLGIFDKIAGEISVSLEKSLTETLKGFLKIQWSPSIDLDFSLVSRKAAVELKSPISATIGAELKGKVEITNEKNPTYLGVYYIPIVVPGVPLGTLSLEIPLSFVYKATAGDVTATFSIGGTRDIGISSNYTPDTGLRIVDVENAFTWTANGTNIVSYEIGTSSSLDLRLRTGVNMSAFFGSAKPLKAQMSTGVVTGLSYKKIAQSSAKDTLFDINCLTGTLDGVTGLEAEATLFGISGFKQTEDVKFSLLKYTALPGCINNNNIIDQIFNVITIAPFTSTVKSGATVQLTAAEKDANGKIVEITPPLIWSSNNKEFPVNSSGLVTVSSVATGVATITAIDTVTGATGSASILVNPYSGTWSGTETVTRSDGGKDCGTRWTVEVDANGKISGTTVDCYGSYSVSGSVNSSGTFATAVSVGPYLCSGTATVNLLTKTVKGTGICNDGSTSVLTGALIVPPTGGRIAQ